jgi:photosystem II stability/assembly factor-like uncharacterized protein
MSRGLLFVGAVGLFQLLASCGGSTPAALSSGETAGASSSAGESASNGGAAANGGSSNQTDGASITVTPSTVAVRAGDTQKFGATVVGTRDTSVTWSVDEMDGGTVAADGTYTAPARVGAFHVTATSRERNGLKATATVNVSEPVTELDVGQWTDVTPLGVKNGSGTGAYHLDVAMSDPAVVYLASDKEGLWKTTDSGKTWKRLGKPDGVFNDTQTEYLEDPCNIAVDPDDANHLYVTEGVDGGRDGFWVSTDGGETFRKPDGFNAIAKKVGGASQDVVQMSTDPADFKHVIISPHSDWDITAGYSSGILESTDGGETWREHLPPEDKWANGTKGVQILHHPQSHRGDGSRWIVGDESTGFWLTTDAGKTWQNVAEQHAPHGGTQFFYTDAGVLYAGAAQTAIVSEDNGQTWQDVPGLPGSTYQQIMFAGGMLWAHGFTPESDPDAKFKVSSDGATWTDDASTGVTKGSPWQMDYDPVNAILYTCNRYGGIWALRLK